MVGKQLNKQRWSDLKYTMIKINGQKRKRKEEVGNKESPNLRITTFSWVSKCNGSGRNLCVGGS